MAFALGVAIPAFAQNAPPGAPDPARIAAGTYTVDVGHTQVFWQLDHMGITPLSGAFAASGGTLQIDPGRPASTKVTVTFALAGMSTTSPAFTKHLSSADFFDLEKYPTATFVSTKVTPTGKATALVLGNLTIKGVTRPVALNTRFYGAGSNPMSKKLNLGFTATASVKRSDFGLGYAVPIVADKTDLRITGAFERAS